MAKTIVEKRDGPIALSALRWLPGGALGNIEQRFTDGEQYLFAVRVHSKYPDGRETEGWEFAVVTARCDDQVGDGAEASCRFEVEGECWDAWDWGSVQWFVPCKEVALPYISGAST